MARFASLLMLMLVVLGVAGAALGFDREKALKHLPDHMVLHAPYTPHHPNGTINPDVIPTLAASAASHGVTVVWTCGGMGEFFTMTVEERKQINAQWVKAGHQHGLYIIVHVGTTVASEAAELARHAQEIGADAIASVPPYYQQAGSFDGLFDFFKPIAAAAPDLGFFFYHIPGSTGYNIHVADLLAAAQNGFPQLLGVKYVSSDNSDWMNSVNQFNKTFGLMYAPEPKMQSFAVGFGRGAVLAEDFFAGTYIRMRDHFLRGDFEAARAEQAWKFSAMAIFSKYGGGAAERAVYRKICGVEMGDFRPPVAPFNDSLYDQLVSELDTIDFWTKLGP